MSASSGCTPRCGNCFGVGHDKDHCTFSRADLELVGHAAAFIGARLQHALPRCNSTKRGLHPVSTIAVDQYKEKWFYVRVYCTLADPERVLSKWTTEGHTGDAPAEYAARCWSADAAYYRRVYMHMVALAPRLKERICEQADHPELLLDDVAAMERYVDQRYVDALRNAMPDYFLVKHDVKTAEELKERLRPAYGRPTLRDMIW